MLGSGSSGHFVDLDLRLGHAADAGGQRMRCEELLHDSLGARSTLCVSAEGQQVGQVEESQDVFVPHSSTAASVHQV